MLHPFVDIFRKHRIRVPIPERNDLNHSDDIIAEEIKKRDVAWKRKLAAQKKKTAALQQELEDTSKAAAIMKGELTKRAS